jgi:hypothetical protein
MSHGERQIYDALVARAAWRAKAREEPIRVWIVLVALLAIWWE